MRKRRFGPLVGDRLASSAARRTYLALEVLEDRAVPAVLSVTHLLDDGSPGSLRAQVAAASSGDTLQFDSSLAGQTMTLTGGAVAINKDLIIQGLGASRLTLNANGASRLFELDGSGTRNITLSGLTLTGGKSSAGGGAILNTNENLTLTDITLTGNQADNSAGGALASNGGEILIQASTLTGNQAGQAGGAVFVGFGNLTLRNVRLSDNTAGGEGGAVAAGFAVAAQSTDVTDDLVEPTVRVESTEFLRNRATGSGGALAIGGAKAVTILNSTLAENTAGGSGGGLFATSVEDSIAIEQTTVRDNTTTNQGGGGIHLQEGEADFRLRQSTLSGNRAGNDEADGGGGLLIDGIDGSVQISNTTVYANAARGSGGGIWLRQASNSARILNSTIAANGSQMHGGGVRIEAGATLTRLESSIVADNSAKLSGPDVSIGGTLVAAYYNLIENGFTGAAPSVAGNNIVSIDPRLGTLANNGGPTATLGLLANSPARDAGSNPEGFTTDQRGGVFLRTASEQPDIGAVEMDGEAPVASFASPGTVTLSGPEALEFSVTFSDNRGIRSETLGGGNVRVTGPGGFNQLATLVSTETGANGKEHVATYRTTAPGGTWTVDDEGTYTVSLESAQVFDVDGNPVASGALGNLTVVSEKSTVVDSDDSTRMRRFAVGADSFSATFVNTFDGRDRTPRFSETAYEPGFRGGVRVATADVTGDGVDDLITGAGPGGGPVVKVFDGATEREIRTFLAYDAGFSGGVFVAGGDVNGDGYDDIITGADAGSFPHVKVYSGIDGSEMYSFLAYGEGFRGGVRVGAADLTGDGVDDVITGAGPGAGPHVKVFCGKCRMAEKASFLAFSKVYDGGVYVAGGEVNGDGTGDMIIGAGTVPHVKVFSGRQANEKLSFLAFPGDFGGGVRVAAADVNDDGREDIVVGAGMGAGPHVMAFDGTTHDVLDSFYALPSFVRGVYVG